jgi:hypothetical protein
VSGGPLPQRRWVDTVGGAHMLAHGDVSTNTSCTTVLPSMMPRRSPFFVADSQGRTRKCVSSACAGVGGWVWWVGVVCGCCFLREWISALMRRRWMALSPYSICARAPCFSVDDVIQSRVASSGDEEGGGAELRRYLRWQSRWRCDAV